MSKDQNHGKAWGRLVFNGKVRPKDERIGAHHKKVWKLAAVPNYSDFKGTFECISKEIAIATDHYNKSASSLAASSADK